MKHLKSTFYNNERLKSWLKKPLVILLLVLLDADPVFVDVSPYETYGELVISCKTLEMPFTETEKRFMFNTSCLLILNPTRVDQQHYLVAFRQTLPLSSEKNL